MKGQTHNKLKEKLPFFTCLNPTQKPVIYSNIKHETKTYRQPLKIETQGDSHCNIDHQYHQRERAYIYIEKPNKSENLI